MEMQTVNGSKNIAAIGFSLTDHANSRGTLRVQFASGDSYDYSGVEQSTWNNFAQAPSKGQFHAAHIKGKYPTQKL